MTLLELDNVRVDTRERTILDVPSLRVADGETVAVLGPNGAGKSTLLRIAGALRRPTCGVVKLDGRTVPNPTLRRSTAAILQRPLLRRGTVLTNVAAGLRFRGASRREARQKATPWLERLGITHLAGADVRTLSGGEAQRVSLARALAVDPRILLLDEPFSALDQTTRSALIADLADQLISTRTSAILVTHDPDEASALAQRIVVLNNGTVQQHGQSARVLDNPTNEQCARTLGYENVLHGSLLGLDGQLAIRADDALVTDDAASHAILGDYITLQGTLQRVLPEGSKARCLVATDAGLITGRAASPFRGMAALKNTAVTISIAHERLRRLAEVSPD